MKDNADTKFGSLSWVEVIPDSARATLPSSRSGHSVVFFEGQIKYRNVEQYYRLFLLARYAQLSLWGPGPSTIIKYLINSESLSVASFWDFQYFFTLSPQ